MASSRDPDIFESGTIDGACAYAEGNVSEVLRRPVAVGRYRAGVMRGADRAFLKDMRNVVRMLNEAPEGDDRRMIADRVSKYLGIFVGEWK